jgi:Fe-S-cluster containining protein
MTTCLSFHAAYRCRHSGACCRAGWSIPFDGDERQSVQALRLAQGSFTPDGTAARHSDGTCSFLVPGSGLCAIHHAGDHMTLPLSCRMFPRVVLHDGRGTMISLSHFCPTAAALLFESGDSWPPAGIVEAPGALTGVGPLDGLDAREAWPPLLRPGVMMDLESYAAWERLGVELLTREGIAPAVSLDVLSSATTRITRWSPAGDTPLLHVVRDSFGMLAPPTDVLEPEQQALKRWLAARLFGNWIAYQGDGLRAIVDYLRNCVAVFTGQLEHHGSAFEAVRRSDLQIVHRA